MVVTVDNSLASLADAQLDVSLMSDSKGNIDSAWGLLADTIPVLPAKTRKPGHKGPASFVLVAGLPSPLRGSVMSASYAGLGVLCSDGSSARLP